ncbi:hypothetical protein KTR66_09050 [Roseococcus sp. SDR]|uniref:hypothetical protein n=1 Tax=Roseococcus sp. SDR TaxID=2835532 RepID=UPI001BCC4AF4|nr:hypothetical protein [Roseococcus sp. SDR]MBS7790141.1 hypothetical protein [Roseococcus sp. SDR]MBV1845455.1 hypothetical protein [Roseococcus sp. SDR]
MTIWIPVGLLGASLVLAETRKLTGRQGGWMGIALPLVFAGSALWLLGHLFLTVDMLAAAESARDGLIAFNAEHASLITVILAVLGFGLGFSGGGRAAGQIALADPDGPMPNIFLPVLTALVGFALVMTAYFRI